MWSTAIFESMRDVAAERTTGRGPAHDFAHVLRVTENARIIAEKEGARPEIVLPAALLHELFSYPKDHPESHRSGEVCAEHAREVLRGLEGSPGLELTSEQIDAIALCIREHPYSLRKVPETLEGRVLQDADRLDAIGAVGIARCFATCGELQRPLFHPDDPFCRQRSPEDRNYGLDHFFGKLLKVAEGLHTRSARAMAEERSRFLQAYLDQLASELGIGPPRG
jgi:uncharacterized protein